MNATDQAVAALHHQLGLDQPLWHQYLLFLDHLVHGDLGDALIYQRPVAALVLERLPDHAVAAGLRRRALAADQRAAGRAGGHRTGTGRATTGSGPFTLVGQGMPQFWVGIMLILLLSVKAGLFPVGGYGEGSCGHVSPCSCRP